MWIGDTRTEWTPVAAEEAGPAGNELPASEGMLSQGSQFPSLVPSFSPGRKKECLFPLSLPYKV